jgi:DtxR family transcriptional regulator, Mn-dependent transcriptional regulator
MANSFTEENYLKIIFKLSAESEGAEVSTNAVAELSQTKAASVSDMLKKLSDKDLVHYQKYQGVRLTAKGEKVALHVIRRHRLWEVFLVDKLHFTWDEVHTVAEELEHIHSEKLVEKLDEFLGFPSFDPHGDPIPDKSGKFPVVAYVSLAELEVGQKGMLMGVSEHSSSFLKYLDSNGLALGSAIEILEINEFDLSMKIKLNQTTNVFFSNQVAKNLLIKLN